MEVEVELQASTKDAVPGVILELDETATVTADGSERYEGVIQTFEDLDAVDGANVNVDVSRRKDRRHHRSGRRCLAGRTRQRCRTSSSTDGTTRQVQVKVGLSEGAYVEITEELSNEELVLVET